MNTVAAKREAARLFHVVGDPDAALATLAALLNEYPDDITGLHMAGEIFATAYRFGLASPMFRRILQLEPEHPEAWHNLAHCLHAHQDIPGSIDAGINSLRFGGDDFHALNHMVLMNSMAGDHRNAIRIYRHARFHAGDIGEIKNAETSAALAYLALGDWENGWRCFETMLGEMKQRKRHSFKRDDLEVPDWDGAALQPGETLAVYGEQGIGDEIMFASILPDLLRDAKAGGWNVTVECEGRLAGLFQRSFGASVFGTRMVKDPDAPERNWRDSFRFGAKSAIGSLAQFYRLADADFPRRAYLTPCATRRKHMRAALARLPGRKIGLAWTGGLPSTRGRDRSLTPEALAPIMDANPGDAFISLEYKGEAPSDPRILHWPEITQSSDYDDTAALVAELDAVVSVTTTVALLAGAIGVPCHVLTPAAATWHWGAKGQSPWLGDWVRLYRREGVDWQSTIDAVTIQPMAAAAQ